MTDAAGNSATGTITVNIVDDVPTATVDSDNVNEGALLTAAATDGTADDVGRRATTTVPAGGVVGLRRQRHLYAGVDRDRDHDCRGCTAR